MSENVTKFLKTQYSKIIQNWFNNPNYMKLGLLGCGGMAHYGE